MAKQPVLTETSPGVYAGTFALTDTHGVPLGTVIEEFYYRKITIDWADWWASAMHKGWPPDRTVSRLHLLIRMTYGPKYGAAWYERMKLLVILHNLREEKIVQQKKQKELQRQAAPAKEG